MADERRDWRNRSSRSICRRSGLALRAADAVGTDYAGVDLLPARDGTVYVLEVNGIPGWEGLQRATGIDVAGAIVDRLAARVHLRRASVVVKDV